MMNKELVTSENMSGIFRVNGRKLTSIGLCSPVVRTRRSWLLPPGMVTLKHMFKEPKLGESQLA